MVAKTVGVALAVALSWSSAVAARSPSEIVITADAARPGPTISRNILGQFSEHLGKGIYEGIWVGPSSTIPNTRGIRNDVVTALKAIKPPNVRWPGGCFADAYHWKNGIGPTRPVSLNASWGGVLEPNTFGSHEFFDFIDQIGADAYLSVNVGSGAPQEAADWLEYLTTDQPSALGQLRARNGHPAPYKVAMLGLGNEAWGCGGSMPAADYVQQMRQFSTYAHNFNPAQQKTDKMLRIAVGPDRDDYAWTETVMQAWTKRVWSWDIDAISLHAYTWAKGTGERATGFTPSQYAALLKDTLRMEEMVGKHAAVMDKYDPDKKVGLVVDEWGTWFAPEPGEPDHSLYQQNTQRDALVAALNLNIFARHADRVRGANIAQMINALQAMILTDGPRMLRTPTYHVFALYAPFQDARLVPLTFEAGVYKEGEVTLPRLDAIGAIGKDGKLWLAMTNLDPRAPLPVKLGVAGYSVAGAQARTLSGEAMGAYNSFEAPDQVAPQPIVLRQQGQAGALVLPPHSVTVIGLNPAR